MMNLENAYFTMYLSDGRSFYFSLVDEFPKEPFIEHDFYLLSKKSFDNYAQDASIWSLFKLMVSSSHYSGLALLMSHASSHQPMVVSTNHVVSIEGPHYFATEPD